MILSNMYGMYVCKYIYIHTYVCIQKMYDISYLWTYLRIDKWCIYGFIQIGNAIIWLRYDVYVGNENNIVHNYIVHKWLIQYMDTCAYVCVCSISSCTLQNICFNDDVQSFRKKTRHCNALYHVFIYIYIHIINNDHHHPIKQNYPWSLSL